VNNKKFYTYGGPIKKHQGLPQFLCPKMLWLAMLAEFSDPEIWTDQALVGIGRSIEAWHLKIYRLEKGIEHFSLNVTQHIHHFHRYSFAIGSSILKIPHPRSHDRLPSKIHG
jgi:hypothetical protein